MGNSQNLSAINEILRTAQARLKNISDAPALDVQWLLLKVLEKNEVSWLYTHTEEKLNQEQKQAFTKLLARRVKGEPLAYILREWEFYGRSFYVNKNVLVPRPSTELLVEKTLQILNNQKTTNNKTFVIADIGTGSGCIIVTLALELTKSKPAIKYKFIATDISSAALNVANQNAKRHRVQNKIEFRQGDMLTPLNNEHIDLIVSNPPYVPSDELTTARQSPTIDTQGIIYEPALALDGGKKGNEYINQIKRSHIPAIVEAIAGKIEILNEKKPWL